MLPKHWQVIVLKRHGTRLSLGVELLDLLHLIVAAHEDTGSVVDVLGLDLEHSLHVAVDSLATGYQLLVNQLNCWYKTLDIPFSKIMAMGAHSYRIRSLPLGLFLSAG